MVRTLCTNSNKSYQRRGYENWKSTPVTLDTFFTRKVSDASCLKYSMDNMLLQKTWKYYCQKITSTQELYQIYAVSKYQPVGPIVTTPRDFLQKALQVTIISQKWLLTLLVWGYCEKCVVLDFLSTLNISPYGNPSFWKRKFL